MYPHAERILNQYDKLPVDLLQELFDYDHHTDKRGLAYVWVIFKGHNGGKYGSVKYLKESTYMAHDTRVTQDKTGQLRVEILDVWFDPELKVTIPPLRG